MSKIVKYEIIGEIKGVCWVTFTSGVFGVNPKYLDKFKVDFPNSRELPQ